ncbi:complex I NDUFA9 subunit family protein [Sinisalibacter aestuarii]|uniref:3-beta-hydroxy-Delta(5)-steroid dehydrogenase n=1 Tax=Sinisalibacter aestuarii TaxID=2949426 RepID=A0ABQ5LNP4_9RHOB|nr:complex I NDUFA9 subunit family protein [Sinisalibacter aestuarii]GKY86627.1 3-beta-hydroxy-Delta(5)-steroid dehydrogenase [Sinisalibacter aestuarii]
MSKLVTIYGGSGFVGRYIAHRMARAGWRVRVAVRRPNEALYVRTYGAVGQVEPVLCNVRNEASVMQTMDGADAVINCVGTFDKGGKNNFDAVQHEAAERIARLAAARGVATLVHISAIGADPAADSLYATTKGLGEAGVLGHFPNAVILRPSVIFGLEDQFFNRFAGMTRLSPVLPIVGGNTKFQPVFVEDVAEAAEMGATGAAKPGIYELGGPDVKTFRTLMQDMLAIIERRRLIVNLPFGLARFFAWWFDLWQSLSGGLIRSPLTVDQVRTLAHDNVVSDGAKGFDTLGIDPHAMSTVLPGYLWRFRVSGQYAAIKASAKNLKV